MNEPAPNGKRVLVVEDEEGLSRLLRIALEEEGYAVDVAGTGEEGLRKARIFRPELLVLDIMLPGMSGYQVCEKLKDDPETRSARVLMLTGKRDPWYEDMGRVVGASEYLTKPFEMPALLATIRRLLT